MLQVRFTEPTFFAQFLLSFVKFLRLTSSSAWFLIQPSVVENYTTKRKANSRKGKDSMPNYTHEQNRITWTRCVRHFYIKTTSKQCHYPIIKHCEPYISHNFDGYFHHQLLGAAPDIPKGQSEIQGGCVHSKSIKVGLIFVSDLKYKTT